jgi:hypothetical protein
MKLSLIHYKKLLLLSVLNSQVILLSAQQPVVWSTYRKVETTEKDFADLKAHGVGLVNAGARNADEAKEKLQQARTFGMKYNIDLPEITESAGLVRSAGFEPVDALMIGGVYQGKAIDRHLFAFAAKKNVLIIEPPVYNKAFAYTAHSGGTGKAGNGEPVGHYYPDMPAPVKAEIIVPLRQFDGKQHLKIIPAEITLAPADAKPEDDTVSPDMPASSETADRQLYQLTFDLSGLDNALLDQVGLAVYWPYHGTDKYWIFSHGNVSAAVSGTQEALRIAVRKELVKWKEANDGVFPLDVVVAARVGDECFYITGHSEGKNATAVSYPLWEYSEPAIQAFKKHAGQVEYPRTWGFPEIYGEEAYGWWLYNLHELTANLIGVVHDEIARTAPGLKLFRNTTRMGIFSLSNNFDGSGQELLTRNLDIVHIDPYPVSMDGYSAAIPRDMSYCAGLSRRYNRLLIPWMQAHIYSRLQDVTPDQVDRMAEEQWEQGIDGLVWLGYGETFPKVRPDSWERAAEFHRKLETSLPPKPKAKLAVLRSYNTIATTSLWEDGRIRNPSDWMLQQFLEVWAVKQKRPYDVFELPPDLTAAQKKELSDSLSTYQYIVSSIPWENAWFINAKEVEPVIDDGEAENRQKQFEVEINQRGWK